MLTTKMLPFETPVEELVERIGMLRAGDVVPPNCFALIPKTPPGAPEPVTRFVRAGERVDAICPVFRVSRLRRGRRAA
jgi:hypothetical protein